MLTPEKKRSAENLEDIITDRAQRLTAYQDSKYADTYLLEIEKIRSADPFSDQPESLTTIAAKMLYKLMAYKDEYEIARLYSDPKFREQLESQFEGDYQIRFNFALPLLRKAHANTKHPRKREFGSWMKPFLHFLAKLRFIRGTFLDPFGYMEERR